ncbi:MAG TPA: response regulator [Sandaracinaceae bacterium LLY-WYZ-13_1]|nr:response regulator [Sandaracinaceae bacterium LLY-WYZ-13_1]
MSNVESLQARIEVLEQRVRELESEAAEAEETRRALALSEERFRLAFLTSPDAISITRARDGRMIDANAGFTEITGWERAEVLGRTTVELDLWVDPEVRQAMAQEVLAHGAIHNLEARFRRKDGSVLWGLFSARALELDGETHMLSVARDVDDLRRAEREREELRAALAESQRLEAIARLASGVAHDFNNLLTVIRGFTGILDRRLGPDGEGREEVQQIDQAAVRAAELTRQLLAFGRRQVLLPRNVDLNELVAGMGRMLDRLIPETIRVELSLGDGLGAVHADPGQLEQVVANLAVNARDAMPDGGVLTLKTGEARREQGPMVLLEVHDTGLGMDEETQARIFEPFFTTKGPERGTGLGLSTVDGIVSQSGGFLEVESTPGRGSVFRVALPRVRGEARPSRVEPVAHEPKRGDEHLLVVEDEPSLRAILERTLTRAGYRVTVAGDGDEALALAERMDRAPDAVVTDVVMPGTTGADVAERLRARWPALKVLFTSGYADEETLRRIPMDASSLFLRKVFTPSELTAAVRDLLDGRGELSWVAEA